MRTSGRYHTGSDPLVEGASLCTSHRTVAWGCAQRVAMTSHQLLPARAFKHTLSNDPHTLCQKGIIFLIFTDRETEAHRDLVTQVLKGGWI